MAAIEQVLIPKSRYERLIQISDDYSRSQDSKNEEIEDINPENENKEISPDEKDTATDGENNTRPLSPTQRSHEEKDYFKIDNFSSRGIKTLKDIKVPGTRFRKTDRKVLKKKFNIKVPKKASVKWVKW